MTARGGGTSSIGNRQDDVVRPRRTVSEGYRVTRNGKPGAVVPAESVGRGSS